MNDTELVFAGVVVGVNNIEDLEIYEGRPNETNPCKEWYIDDSAIERQGFYAVVQRHSRCRAYILEKNVPFKGISGTTDSMLSRTKTLW